MYIKRGHFGEKMSVPVTMFDEMTEIATDNLCSIHL